MVAEPVEGSSRWHEERETEGDKEEDMNNRDGCVTVKKFFCVVFRQ